MRQFASLSIDQLIEAARTHWADPAELQSLMDETEFRRTKKAASLKRDIAKRLAVLGFAGSERDAESSRRQSTSEATQNGPMLDPRVVSTLSAFSAEEILVAWRWGLSALCDDGLLSHAAKLWRKRLHPDSHPSASPIERAGNEELLKQFEQDLRSIRAMRERKQQ